MGSIVNYVSIPPVVIFYPMSLLGLLYSTLTGLTLAAFYMLNKRVAHAGRPMLIIFWIFAAHLPVFVAWALMAMPLRVTPLYFLPGVAVIALTVAGNLLTIRALSLSPFSLVVPVLGLSPVFASLIGIPLLHEWPSATQWLGICLAVLGVLWLYAPPEKPWNILAFWPAFVRERGAVPITLAALMWAICAPMDKLALRQADAQFHALFVFIGFVLALGTGLAVGGEFRTQSVDRAAWKLLALTGGIGGVSYGLQLTALQYAAAGPFEAIKRVMNQLLALAFGYILFHEKITKPKLIGIGILCVGVPLIVL
jgi:transporter family protein